MKSMLSIALIGLGFLLLSFSNGEPWNVPDEYKKMKNPVAASDESVDIGESLWKVHCKSCHGKEGLGDGPKSAQLDTDPGDFSAAAFQKQTDGEIFYKTWIGRDEMPNYQKKIPEKEDVWHLVNYMRTMGE